MARPFAVFDIDGTIIRWQLYHALADELARDGNFDSGQYKKVKDARMEWKNRANAASFKEYEEMLVSIFNMALANISLDRFSAAIEKVIDEYKDQIYTYTRELIVSLKRENYLLFAISASQDEIVKRLARHYDFDEALGTAYEVKDGHFTGKYDLLMSTRKPEKLKELVVRHGASWEGSIAVGDSESDIPMLSCVEQPIAFNPTKELFTHASKVGWKIVIERKNMVYELEPADGQYQLAKTNAG